MLFLFLQISSNLIQIILLMKKNTIKLEKVWSLTYYSRNTPVDIYIPMITIQVKIIAAVSSQFVSMQE